MLHFSVYLPDFLCILSNVSISLAVSFVKLFVICLILCRF
ncbi:hypothetical protein CLOHYLEM_05934 [[Clostridium] hylemonae DSM 15053]|uniref:Uncharacterized protein n=1 Tax=[Clostridium] hylemonae DSM 15053 TaxID=553973 RepID=C0C1B6_9FIRM|nr:hypothetical protein CLOHYLEM_05934 [[Clostridium] hylemonae DSM 15053]